jgi:hypothetical protein
MTVTVTDHALLRWLERVQGIDIEAVRAEIAARAERCVAAAESIGTRPAQYVVLSGDARLIVRQGAVVTVVTADMRIPVRNEAVR